MTYTRVEPLSCSRPDSVTLEDLKSADADYSVSGMAAIYGSRRRAKAPAGACGRRLIQR